MRFDWSKLGGRTPPKSLVDARLLAHHALQWVCKTARANLRAAADDAHSSVEWHPALSALVSRPFPASGGEVRAGLRVAGFALVVLRGEAVIDAFQLEHRTDAEAGAWMDSKLRALGLKPAGGVKLPYAVPDHAVARGAAYDTSSAGRELGELARWFAGAADLLDEFKAKLKGPRAGPVRCWPHHFDIATVVPLREGAADAASVGIGVSPGDEFYAQPYVYVSPSPRFDSGALPSLPAPGHWHTQGFLGAVTTGEEILALKNRGPELLAFVAAAFEIAHARLEAQLRR
jgi:hypothetical protein